MAVKKKAMKPKMDSKKHEKGEGMKKEKMEHMMSGHKDMKKKVTKKKK